MSVTHLIRGASQGDRDASEELWTRMLPLLRAEARQRLSAQGIPARSASENDLAQTAVRRFLEDVSWSQVPDGRHFYGLLATIIRRRVIDLGRRRFMPSPIDQSTTAPRTREVALGDLEIERSEGESPDLAASLRDGTEWLVARLPGADYARVFFLLLEDPRATNVEIGERLGKGEAAIRRIRKVIAATLESYADELNRGEGE